MGTSAFEITSPYPVPPDSTKLSAGIPATKTNEAAQSGGLAAREARRWARRRSTVVAQVGLSLEAGQPDDPELT
jgi:hypothetical protein